MKNKLAMQKRKIKILIFGSIIGALLIYFLPIIPQSLPNKDYTSTSFYFFSTSMITYLPKEFLLFEVVGSLLGFLGAFIYVGGFEN